MREMQIHRLAARQFVRQSHGHLCGRYGARVKFGGGTLDLRELLRREQAVATHDFQPSTTGRQRHVDRCE
ncbi:MAG: hypothetical protein QM775_10770 [Pirellulales bacterium]